MKELLILGHKLSYLDKKVQILEQADKVVFEHNQQIFQIFLRDDEEYEVNVYDLFQDDFVSGDELEAIDGGICSGSAKDAVYFMIEE